jgi:hypothetical protein
MKLFGISMKVSSQLIYLSDVMAALLLLWYAYKGDWKGIIAVASTMGLFKLSAIVDELMELNATMKEKTVLDKRTARWAELYMNHFVPKGKDDGPTKAG